MASEYGAAAHIRRRSTQKWGSPGPPRRRRRRAARLGTRPLRASSGLTGAPSVAAASPPRLGGRPCGAAPVLYTRACKAPPRKRPAPPPRGGDRILPEPWPRHLDTKPRRQFDTSTPHANSTNSTPLDTSRHHLGWDHARRCQGAKLDTSVVYRQARLPASARTVV